MTRDDVRSRLLFCAEIDAEDVTEESTLGDFVREDELYEVVEAVESQFNIRIEELTTDVTIESMVDELCKWLGVTV